MLRIPVRVLPILLLALQAVGEPDNLLQLSQTLSHEARSLQRGARRVIGPYPNPWQYQAFDHIRSLRNSSEHFQQVVELTDPDVSPLLSEAFMDVERDAFFARALFDDLFDGFDPHSSHEYKELNKILTHCEIIIEKLDRLVP